MKHIITLLSIFFVTTLAWGQSSKQVKWTYTAKKVADKTYEIHLTASMNGNWHIYSQNVGVDGPIPTNIVFSKNPLVVVDGKPKEVGKMIKKKEEVWGGVVNYYEKTVNFVQKVKIKGDVKTNMTGKIEFMVCDDSQCLPPSEINFEVSVGG